MGTQGIDGTSDSEQNFVTLVLGVARASSGETLAGWPRKNNQRRLGTAITEERRLTLLNQLRSADGCFNSGRIWKIPGKCPKCITIVINPYRDDHSKLPRCKRKSTQPATEIRYDRKPFGKATIRVRTEIGGETCRPRTLNALESSNHGFIQLG